MLLRLTNTPRDYAWGSTTALAELFHREPSGRPEAELWLGTHPGSTAHVVGTGESLASVLEGHPLPFLLKVLAASAPLSLQAHPTTAQAVAGFARENAAGIALDDPARNYKDDRHKPELIVAISETFDALCGFRPVAATRAVLERLGAPAEPLLARLHGDDDLRAVVGWLSAGGEDVVALVAAVSAAAAPDDSEPSIATVAELAVAYPGDPGILVSLLLNRVTLRRGQALYLAAGNIHAYLRGVGVELMAASDNVLRGGLTPKHVDVPELLEVLDFRATPAPYLEPVAVTPGVEAFAPGVPDFELLHVTADAALAIPASAIAVCTAGSFTIAGLALAPGEALYASSDESPLAISGAGDLWVATSSGG